MKIIVIDDKREELEKATAAIEAAGHEALSFPNLSYYEGNLKMWERMAEADGVITDLFFDPRYSSNRDVKEAYSANPPAMGLVVALHALHLGKPVVICTSGYHHGPELSFIYDTYVAHNYGNTAFGWEENKNWGEAVKLLEDKLAR